MQRQHAPEMSCAWVVQKPDPEAHTTCACLALAWQGGWDPPEAPLEGSLQQGLACASVASCQRSTFDLHHGRKELAKGCFKSLEPNHSMLRDGARSTAVMESSRRA